MRIIAKTSVESNWKSWLRDLLDTGLVQRGYHVWRNDTTVAVTGLDETAPHGFHMFGLVSYWLPEPVVVTGVMVSDGKRPSYAGMYSDAEYDQMINRVTYRR